MDISTLKPYDPSTEVCKNCALWYKNSIDHGKNCIWKNEEVPTACDYCSRFIPKHRDETK